MPIITQSQPHPVGDFFFIHVPKTGGCSVARALEEITGFHWSYFRGHATAYNFEQYYTDLWERQFSFAFVRNPFDQIVSWFLYHRRNGQHHHQYDTFEEWVYEGMSHGWSDNISLFKGLVWRWPYDPEDAPAPYDTSRMICDPDGKVLVDFVGRFENLEEDWSHVCSRLGFYYPLPHANKVEGRSHYRDYYTPEVRRVVEEHQKHNLDRFNYTF